jgi:hypothetical protein
MCTDLLCLHQGMFECQYHVNTVGDVDWVCLGPNRKVWKASLNMVMSVQVV